jgi:hypothetical protein
MRIGRRSSEDVAVGRTQWPAGCMVSWGAGPGYGKLDCPFPGTGDAEHRAAEPSMEASR